MTSSSTTHRIILPLPVISKNRKSSQGRPSSQSSPTSSSEAEDYVATPESSNLIDNSTGSRKENEKINNPNLQADSISHSFLMNSGVSTERSATPKHSDGKQNPTTPDPNTDLKIAITPDHELPQPLPTLEAEERISGDNSETLPEVVKDPYHTFSSDGIEVRGSLSPRPSHSRRSSESSFATDLSDEDAKYVVEDEEGPVELYFTEAFQSVLRRSYDVAIEVAHEMKKLDKTFENDSTFKRLLNDAKELSAVNISSTRTIAILGASGEGKSSLINSLLHVTELARTGDEGSACTSVVTEYRQKTKNTIEPFSIEVEYLSSSERQVMVEELLWSFRQLFLPRLDTEQEIDSEEQKRIERESTVAKSALESVFHQQKGFSVDFLSDNSEGASERIKIQLLEWIKNIEFPADDSGLWKASADTSDECQELTSAFLEDRLWPFTKMIRVYLDAEVLKTGVVLADLPGLQDTNLARVQATQKYLLNCDHVFIATRISRAVTDATLKSALYDELKRHVPLAWEESGAGNTNFRLAVICTRSEDINSKTAKRTFVGNEKEIAPNDLSVLDKAINNAKRKGDKELKDELERKKLWLFIEARNKRVTKGLQIAYREKIPNGNLDVFCISNTTYEDYTEKGDTEMVKKSGIPELRRFCRKITASAQLLQALNFMRSKLPSLLNSIKIWTESINVAAQIHNDVTERSVLDHYERSKEEAIALVIKHHGEFKNALQNDILRFFSEFANGLSIKRTVLNIQQDAQTIQWEATANGAAKKWCNWPHQSYSAWCRNNGEHNTATKGYVNWNAEMIERMREDLKSKWELLEERITSNIDGLLDEVSNKLRSLRVYLEEVSSSATILNGIGFAIQDLEYEFSIIQQVFTRGLKIIRQYVDEPNASSFIVTEMIPAYRKARSEGGTGMSARQKSIVTNQISNGTIFPNISDKLRQGAITVIDSQFNKLKRNVNDSFDLIQNDIEMTVSENLQSCNNAVGAEAKELTEKLAKLSSKYDEILRIQQNIVDA